MAADKQKVDLCITVRVNEDTYALIEKRTEELQRRTPVGITVTTTDIVRSALLRGLKNKDD